MSCFELYPAAHMSRIRFMELYASPDLPVVTRRQAEQELDLHRTVQG